MSQVHNPILNTTSVGQRPYGDYILKFSSIADKFYVVSAWLDGTKIAEANWRAIPYPDGYTMGSIWVAPEHQRKGIGSQLWYFANDIADGKVEGCKAAKVTVGPNRTEEVDLLARSLGIEMPPIKTK